MFDVAQKGGPRKSVKKIWPQNQTGKETILVENFKIVSKYAFVTEIYYFIYLFGRKQLENGISMASKRCFCNVENIDII